LDANFGFHADTFSNDTDKNAPSMWPTSIDMIKAGGSLVDCTLESLSHRFNSLQLKMFLFKINYCNAYIKQRKNEFFCDLSLRSYENKIVVRPGSLVKRREWVVRSSWFKSRLYVWCVTECSHCMYVRDKCVVYVSSAYGTSVWCVTECSHCIYMFLLRGNQL